MTFDKFLEDINTCLMMQAEEPVSNAEQWLIVQCFDAGRSVEETREYLLYDRGFAPNSRNF